MLDTLRKIWSDVVDNTAASELYIVYAAGADKYVAFALKNDIADRIIHNTIAKRENNHPSRQYQGVVQPGSFNFTRVHAVNADKAMVQAKAEGLVHEPIKTVLSRYINAKREEPTPSDLSAAKAELDKIMKGLDDFISGDKAPKPKP